MCFRSSFCIYIHVKNFLMHHSLGPFSHASFMSHFFTSTLHINEQGHGFLHLHAKSSLLWLIMNILHLVLLYFWGVLLYVHTRFGWMEKMKTEACFEICMKREVWLGINVLMSYSHQSLTDTWWRWCVCEVLLSDPRVVQFLVLLLHHLPVAEADFLRLLSRHKLVEGVSWRLMDNPRFKNWRKTKALKPWKLEVWCN